MGQGSAPSLLKAACAWSPGGEGELCQLVPLCPSPLPCSLSVSAPCTTKQSQRWAGCYLQTANGLLPGQQPPCSAGGCLAPAPSPPSRRAHAGPVPQTLAHEAPAAWQMGRKGPVPWPCPPDQHSSSHHPTGLFSALAWHGGGCFVPPDFPNPLSTRKLHRKGRLVTSRYPEASSACPLAGVKRSPVPFCTSIQVAGVKIRHWAAPQFLIPMFLSLEQTIFKKLYKRCSAGVQSSPLGPLPFPVQ